MADTILVTWLDGIQATYRGETKVSDGVLHIYEYNNSVLIAEWHLPVANIRHWTKPRGYPYT